MKLVAKTNLRLVAGAILFFACQPSVFAQTDGSLGSSLKDNGLGSSVFVLQKPRKFFSDSPQTQTGSGSKSSGPKKVVHPVKGVKKGQTQKAPEVVEEIAPEEWINEAADYAVEERKSSDSEPFLSLKSGFLNTRYQFCASPQFPSAARKAKQKLVQSKVLITVAKYGGVLHAKTLEGDPSFRTAVYGTLESMRFRESYFMGQPIRIEGLLSFTQNPANEIVCNTSSQEVEIPTLIEGGDLDAYAKTCEIPDFPADAKSAGLKSVTAKVQIIVGEDGKVVEAKLIEGHPTFGQAAVQSALKTAFPRSMITHKYVKVRGMMNFTQTPDNQTKCAAGLTK